MSLAELQNKQTMVYESEQVSEYNFWWNSILWLAYWWKRELVIGSKKKKREVKVDEKEGLRLRNLKFTKLSEWRESTDKRQKYSLRETIPKGNSFVKLTYSYNV